MNTAAQIAFSHKIQSLKEENGGTIQSFVLFEAFAIWLRQYVQPWTQPPHADAPDHSFNRIRDAADTFDRAIRSAVKGSQKTAAHAQFILDIIFDPIDPEPKTIIIQKPIIFYGANPSPGIHDFDTLSRIQNLKLVQRKQGIAASGNYDKLLSLAAAIHCFKQEAKALKRKMRSWTLDAQPRGALIKNWLEKHLEETPAVSNLPSSRIPAHHEETPAVSNLPSSRIPAHHEETPAVSNLPSSRIPAHHEETPAVSNLPSSRIPAHHEETEDSSRRVSPGVAFYYGFIECFYVGAILSIAFSFANLPPEIHDDIFSLPGGGPMACLWIGVVVGVVVGFGAAYYVASRQAATRNMQIVQGTNPSDHSINTPLLDVSRS